MGNLAVMPPTIEQEQAQIIAERRRWNAARRDAVRIVYAAQLAGGDWDRIQRIIACLIAPDAPRSHA